MFKIAVLNSFLYAALAQSSGPFWLTAHVFSSAPISTSIRFPPAGLVPALLTNMSNDPNCSLISLHVWSAAASSSAFAITVWKFSLLTVCFNSSRVSGFRPVTITFESPSSKYF